MNLNELDKVLSSTGMPVRSETLAEAWELAVVRERPRHVLILVTMRARAGMEHRLETAAREFAKTTLGLPGALGSSLHRSPGDPRTWFLLERFASEESFARHMGSDYFARFQEEQRELLAEPVQALFLERG